MSSNFCVSCGAEIPDGSLVCYGCTNDRSDKALDMVKEIFTTYGDLIDVPEINSESVLVLRFNHNNQTIDDTQMIFDLIKEVLPDNKVIVMPDDMTLNTMSKMDAIGMLRDILNWLEERTPPRFQF